MEQAIALFLAGTLLLVLTGVLAIVVIRSVTRRPSRQRIEDDTVERSTTSLNPYAEPPLSARKVSLKICPDCRELVLLAAHSCKYCGTAFPFETKPAADRTKTPAT